MNHPIHIVSVVIVCAFWGIGPFRLTYEIYVCSNSQYPLIILLLSAQSVVIALVSPNTGDSCLLVFLISSAYVLVRILQSNRINKEYKYREFWLFVCLRNWFTQLWELVRPKSLGKASRLEASVDVALLSQKAEFLLPWESQSFFLRPSTNWTRPNHIMESNCFIQSLLI